MDSNLPILNILSVGGAGATTFLVDSIPLLTAISLLLVIYLNLETIILGDNRGILARVKRCIKRKKVSSKTLK